MGNHERVLRTELANPGSSFSIGCFGAIAEFHRAPEEPLTALATDKLTVATARGALRIALKPKTVAIAYETLSGRAGRWHHGVIFCLPRQDAAGAARSVIFELGPDSEAIQAQDREDILFDIGVSAQNVDFCIRTSDPELLRVLRGNLGHSVFDAKNPAMAAILGFNPHRIAISALGRCEVYQAIGSKVTPEGPHTHVLPKLLASGRSQSANVPAPEGHLPCLSLFPANPLCDGLGREKPFDAEAQAAFEKLARMWARPEHQAEKERVRTAIDFGVNPEDYAAPTTRPSRRALRIALRQMAAARTGPPRIEMNPWLTAFDRHEIADSDAPLEFEQPGSSANQP